ncbi:acriflavin resistance protein [Thermosinus carboxydivorans Nor1]|uniref:Acriflavin resistance protein n=1 Tax=Thermosinus carboxydivorans Nor1 TaxID=401526 RepID=A1HMN6_9FIRM|nr:efflux RND transporter permease subunit [Thermosinus carboxydivorans]EAX48525.1 acriflavin resistance protein [Thermosinus carboxydivorans Nor1]
MNSGLAGRIAKAFITSKLTPIIVIVSLLVGVFVTVITPREEEPQIVVPMVDVLVSYPGASAEEVRERVTRPLEQLLWEITGVEYVYSIVQPGQNLTIVRFYVGENTEASLVKLYTKLMANYDRIPPGVSQPLVKARSIDDVPVLALTLWSDAGHYSGYELRRVAVELAAELKKDDNVSECTVIGGQRRQFKVTLDAGRLAAYNTSVPELVAALQKANVALAASTSKDNREYSVKTGALLYSAADLADVVVAVRDGRPVYLKDVATVDDRPGEPDQYVFMGLGPAAAYKAGIPAAARPEADREAVTVAVAKKKGANASLIADRALAKAEALRGVLIPGDINITVTRNYGETAKEKSDELLEHMLIATFSVVILMALALGWREAAVVAVAVPVTLALTLLVNYLYGYTLNRVTLFALIFSIGILVDDAIVVVENIHRHFRLNGVSVRAAVAAVDEVGNPTILATFTVIAALLPMAFVSGLMGPYMRPIPVGASAAMLFSLLVAFIVSPWLSYKVLKNTRHHKTETEAAGRLHAWYTGMLAALVDDARRRRLVLGGMVVLLAAAVALIPLKAVMVKMLPFDNKSEIELIVDLPEDAPLERTAALARELGEYLKTVPEVTDYQAYIGTAAPYNFNGLVRHYYMRQGASTADIQVNLVAKDKRSAQSHDIAKRLRPVLTAIADRYGARLKVAEVPPGPPVLSTLVAEVYGPDRAGQLAVARRVKEIFASTPGVVDVDWYVENDRPKLVYEVDRGKAALSGVDVQTAAQTVQAALGGFTAGLAHVDKDKEPVEVVLRLPPDERGDGQLLARLTVPTADGRQVPLAGLVQKRETVEDKTIYHKNLRQVTYVVADVAGQEESPVYAILKMRDRISRIGLSGGDELKQYSAVQPWLEDRYAIKWDGEWHITQEVFRDMGLAFAVVLVLIYILVVAWFKSFVTPVIIMAPIPLTLVGILPGHWLFGAFFTATSMIGFIALAGIIVRNSILLVDFVESARQEQGDVRQAVIAAGAVRVRPIVLTALAVVVGSFVMLFDPIFQGLAIAMMFGAVAATVLTLFAVPLLYYELYGRPAKDKALGVR